MQVGAVDGPWQICRKSDPYYRAFRPRKCQTGCKIHIFSDMTNTRFNPLNMNYHVIIFEGTLQLHISDIDTSNSQSYWSTIRCLVWGGSRGNGSRYPTSRHQAEKRRKVEIFTCIKVAYAKVDQKMTNTHQLALKDHHKLTTTESALGH